jgi:hypothetical protein
VKTANTLEKVLSGRRPWRRKVASPVRRMVADIVAAEVSEYRAATPAGRWFIHQVDRRFERLATRTVARERCYGPPKIEAAALPVNRVAAYFTEKGPTSLLKIAPGQGPDPSLVADAAPVQPDAMFGKPLGDVYGRNVATGISPATPLDKTIITTAGGSTATAASGNNLTVPTGYSGVAVWIGEQPNARALVRLYVKVGSTTTAYNVFSWGHLIVKAAAGTTVVFNTQTRTRTSATLSDTSLEFTVMPVKVPAALPDPATVTTTISPDQASPNLWAPNAVAPHLVFEREHGFFKVAAKPYRRDIFVQEWDGGANFSPIRHVHIPAGRARTIQVRMQIVFVGHISNEDLDVVLPAGVTVIGGRNRWEPDFTPSQTITVSTTAELKTAINTNADNVKIRVVAGLYDMTGVSLEMKTANYTNGVANSRWIESASGARDVIFQVANPAAAGMQWGMTLGSGKSWTLKGIVWNCTGAVITGPATGMIDFAGALNLVDCLIYGQISTGDTLVKCRSTSGTIVSYWAWCDILDAKDDSTAANVEGGTACTVHQIGCRIDGNGSGGTAQLVTNHGGGVQVGWGCRYGNLTNGNTPRIISENGSSPIYLYFCYSRDTDVTGSTGISIAATGAPQVNPTTLFFCEFAKASNMSSMFFAVGCKIGVFGTTTPFMYCAVTGKTLLVGCDITGVPGAGANGNQIVDAIDADVEMIGCRITDTTTTASNGMLRIFRTTGGPWTGTVTQCTFKAPGGASTSPAWTIGTASAKLTIQNAIFAGQGIYTISGSTNQTSTTAGSYYQKKTAISTAPTGWDTGVAAFSGTPWASLGSNQKSASDPALDAYDAPTVSGNVDGTGTTLAILGGVDIYGNPYLGGTFSPGAVERQEIRGSGILHPAQW